MIVLNAHQGQQPFAADWREGVLWRRPPSDRMPFLLCERHEGLIESGPEPRLLEWSSDHYRAALVPWLAIKSVHCRRITKSGEKIVSHQQFVNHGGTAVRRHPLAARHL